MTHSNLKKSIWLCCVYWMLLFRKKPTASKYASWLKLVQATKTSGCMRRNKEACQLQPQLCYAYFTFPSCPLVSFAEEVQTSTTLGWSVCIHTAENHTSEPLFFSVELEFSIWSAPGSDGLYTCPIKESN